MIDDIAEENLLDSAPERNDSSKNLNEINIPPLHDKKTNSEPSSSPKRDCSLGNNSSTITIRPKRKCTFLIRFDSDESTVSKSTKSESLDKEEKDAEAPNNDTISPFDIDHHQRETDLFSPLMYDKDSFIFGNSVGDHSRQSNNNDSDDGDDSIASGNIDGDARKKEDVTEIAPRFVLSQEYDTIESFQPQQQQQHSGQSSGFSGSHEKVSTPSPQPSLQSEGSREDAAQSINVESPNLISQHASCGSREQASVPNQPLSLQMSPQLEESRDRTVQPQDGELPKSEENNALQPDIIQSPELYHEKNSSQSQKELHQSTTNQNPDVAPPPSLLSTTKTQLKSQDTVPPPNTESQMSQIQQQQQQQQSLELPLIPDPPQPQQLQQSANVVPSDSPKHTPHHLIRDIKQQHQYNLDPLLASPNIEIASPEYEIVRSSKRSRLTINKENSETRHNLPGIRLFCHSPQNEASSKKDEQQQQSQHQPQQQQQQHQHQQQQQPEDPNQEALAIGPDHQMNQPVDFPLSPEYQMVQSCKNCPISGVAEDSDGNLMVKASINAGNVYKSDNDKERELPNSLESIEPVKPDKETSGDNKDTRSIPEEHGHQFESVKPINSQDISGDDEGGKSIPEHNQHSFIEPAKQLNNNNSIGISGDKNEGFVIQPGIRPPSMQQVRDTLSQHNLSETHNQGPYFSDDKDLQDRTK